MNSKSTQTGLILSFDRGTLVLSGADRWPGVGSRVEPWAWDDRIAAWRCDAVHYPCVHQDLMQHLGSALQDEVPQPARVLWPKVELPPLRTEQLEALSSWTKAGCRGQVIMPTGTGKTEVALAAMAQTQMATLVVAPIRDLMHQWHRRILKGLGYDAGILGDNTFNLRPVTVTTYDSASIHMAQIGAHFGLLVFDEEHHLPGPTYREAAIMSTAAIRLGLTATPERHDGRQTDLDWLVGPVAFVFRHADGTQVLMEIVGFWTPEYLAAKRRTLRRFRDHRILIALPQRSVREGAAVGDNGILYKTALKLGPVVAALERFRLKSNDADGSSKGVPCS